MEITVQHPITSTTVSFKIDSTIYRIGVTTSSSNCKLCTLENVQSNFERLTDIQKKELMDGILRSFTGRNVLITINSKLLWEWFKTNYKYYYANIVPIGYGTGDQHHILLKNNNDTREPIVEPKPVIAEVKKLCSVRIAEIVENALSKKRLRKERAEQITKDLIEYENNNK